MMKRFMILIVLLIFALSLASCSSEPSDESNAGFSSTVIRINGSNNQVSAIQLVIRYKELLEPYLPDGVTVEWTDIANAADQRDAIVAGRVDIAGVAVPNVITALDNGLPLVIISAAAGSPVYMYSNNPDIQKFQDINAETRISLVTKGNAPHLAFLAKCKDVFGEATIFENNLVPMPHTEALASLESGRELDCSMFSLPTTLRANEIEGIQMIDDLTPYINEYGLTSYFVANEDFYKLNPMLIEAFRMASRDAVEYIRNNLSEVSILLGDLYEVDSVHIEEALLDCPPSLEVRGFDRLVDLMFEAGILANEPMRLEDLPNFDDIP